MFSFLQLLLLLIPYLTSSAFYVLDRGKGKNCCWTVLSVIPTSSVEMSPLPGSAAEKHISTVCDYTVFSTLNLVCADFIFVGCETLLSGVPRNAGRKGGYYAWGNSTWSHTPALLGHFHWVASQKGPHAWPEKQRGVRK